jgi:Cu/Ag efflux protein CusF
MKTTKAKTWTAVCAAVLTATAAFRASADQSAAARPEKSYTGTVSFVDPTEHVLRVKGWTMLNKTFNFGDNCAFTQLDENPGTAGDLRAGEKVRVSYQDSHGVLIADRVAQQPMRSEGMVKAIDPTARTLTLHLRGLDKTFQIANDCNVLLRDDKSGKLADIQTGNHVTVTYETPDGMLTARQIAQTSIEFTGTLTAIDLGEKTLKAKAEFTSKKFNVADNCAIVINGKTDGRLSDLKPDEKLVFSYDEINGVNVVNRIAPAEARPNSVAATTPTPMTGY